MTRNPFQYLYDLAHSDRAVEHDVNWMNTRLQEHFPGNYKVSAKYVYGSSITYHYEYYLDFDTAADETWFRLQYT